MSERALLMIGLAWLILGTACYQDMRSRGLSPRRSLEMVSIVIISASVILAVLDHFGWLR